jgi:Uma2 family endonuclease
MSHPRMLSSISTNEFLASPAAQGRSELVRGRVRPVPLSTGAHSKVSGNVSRLLAAHVERKKLGRCFDGTAQFELPNVPNTVRTPDASFVRTERLPLGGAGGGWLSLSPDLAVEILSSHVSAAELEEKLADYRAAGTPLVWLINPERRSVAVITANDPMRWLGDEATLDGGDVVPGFSCAVAAVFEGVPAGH